jgi:hypothetical protein
VVSPHPQLAPLKGGHKNIIFDMEVRAPIFIFMIIWIKNLLDKFNCKLDECIVMDVP